MGVRCGMDLGTTYSAVSYYDHDTERVETIDLETADGAKILRSVVYYPGPGQPVVVGDAAWNAAKQAPERVLVGIKRSMGTGYRTPEIDGVSYSPPEVSAEILKALARDAEVFLAEPVKDVVITVPAYFGDAERAATEEAGKLAGLNVLGLLPEPHAAALAYAVHKVAEIHNRHLLVYDLGGGTFDVTLIHATSADAAGGQNLEIRTLCKDGNASLGGLDWDRALAEIVAEKVLQQYGTDVWLDPKNEAVLLDNCEKAKRDLTRTSSVSIVADLEHHQVDVSATEFAERTRDLLMQTQMLLLQVLQEAKEKHGINPDEIDVLLAGGSTRMPAVREMIQGVTGRPPLQHKNPELLVTAGAAYWAHLMQEGATVPTTVPTPEGPKKSRTGITEVSDTGRAVGVEILRPDGQGGMRPVNKVIVKEGAPYEEQFERVFGTAEDGATEIEVRLYEGESEEISECTLLMTFTITGIPPGRPRGERVTVRLGYDRSGILRGEAVAATGQKVDIVVDRSLQHHDPLAGDWRFGPQAVDSAAGSQR